MQRRSLRRAVPVHHREGAWLDGYGIDHQRVALIMADGVAIIGRFHIGWMLRMHADLADLMIELIDDRDPVGLLEHRHSNRQNEGYPVGPTLIARIVKAEIGL